MLAEKWMIWQTKKQKYRKELFSKVERMVTNNLIGMFKYEQDHLFLKI